MSYVGTRDTSSGQVPWQYDNMHDMDGRSMEMEKYQDERIFSDVSGHLECVHLYGGNLCIVTGMRAMVRACASMDGGR